MIQYQQKRVSVQAFQWIKGAGKELELPEWVKGQQKMGNIIVVPDGAWVRCHYAGRNKQIDLKVAIGEWLILGPNGCMSICDSDSFSMTYELKEVK